MSNVIAYSLQIAALVAVAGFIPWLVRMKMPGARLAFWQAVLAACLALPLIRPWRVDAAGGLVSITSRVTGPLAAGHGFAVNYPMVLAAGIVIRLGWLALGLLRLRRYRRNAQPFDGGTVLISQEVSSPVTFGFLRPVILLPARFPQLEPAMRDAILRHERLHVKRHDWVFAVTEEVVRAMFWFHPAIWWTLGEIQLAREQVVDRAVIAATQLPDRYVDALLAIPGATPQPDLAPAPLFLRRRHLKQRVFSLLKEVRMSRAKSWSALAGGLAMVAAACWFVTGAIPLTAAQKIRVGGNVAAANLISQVRPAYPPDAKAARVQGVVRLSVDIGEDGKVESVTLIDGPPELVQSAVDAVKQWVYRPTLLNGEPVGITTTVEVNYTLSQ